MFKATNSIEDVGLETYLNDTAEQHNGKNYIDFLDYKSKGVNRANMAYIFGVMPSTMGKWWRIYYTEASRQA